LVYAEINPLLQFIPAKISVKSKAFYYEKALLDLAVFLNQH